MSRTNLVGTQLAAILLDKNLSPEDFGPTVGVSGMTIRRAMEGKTLSRNSKWHIARALQEDPSTLWPPRLEKKRAGQPRKGQNPHAGINREVAA